MIRSSTLIAIATVAASLGSASALESQVVGPRALGMGGVGVACADDYVAQYYNPAMFGFFWYTNAKDERAEVDNNQLCRKVWGFGVDATVGARINGDLATYANDLLKIDVNKIKALGQSGTPDQKTLQDMLTALKDLSSLDLNRDAITADSNIGTGIRIGHFGIGARVTGQATARLTSIDTTHIGIDSAQTSNIADKINVAAGNAQAPSGWQPSVFTADQKTQITNTLTNMLQNSGVSASTIDAAVYNLDKAAASAGITQSQIAPAVTTLNNALSSSGVSSLSFGQNTTTVQLRAFGLGEIPVTYGWAINDNISVGVTGKLMIGRLYGTRIQVLNTTTDKQLADYARDLKDQYTQTMNAGIDVGVVARTSMLQGGLVAHNINAPTFDGPTVNGFTFDPVRVNPSLVIGAAFMPWDTVTLASDYEITNGTSTLEGYDVRKLGGGLEWNIWHILALRGGLSKNLAEDDIGLLYHAGLGLNLWLMRVDLAGSMSPQKVTVDGKEYPKEARASFALATDW